MTVTGLCLLSCSQGNVAMALVFLPDAFTDPAARPFAESVAAGNVPAALAAARYAPSGVNALGANGETGLLMAVERQNLGMVDALLKAGANPNGGADRAPIALAVRSPDLRFVRHLLVAGADPNGRIDTEPALYNAARVGAHEAINLLVAHHARVDEPDSLGSPATFSAAGADRWTVVLQFLGYGASPVATNRAGLTLAKYASTSRLIPDDPEGRALITVINRLRAAGASVPP
jgi:ankyrin repeat protein